MRETLVTNCEKSFVLNYIGEGKRIDGRNFNEFRELIIDFGQDWGSCYVQLGKTKVLTQVSCEVQQPKSAHPSEGILNINVELNTMAAPHFEIGRQTDMGVHLNRILEKSIKDCKAIDLETLCIKMNEKVWCLRVDINVLCHEGNILDCASISAIAALAHFRRPDVSCDGEEFVIHSVEEKDPIPTVLHHYPICVTYAIFNRGVQIVADPTLLEEQISEAHLTIGMNAYSEVCALHLGGKVELSTDLLLKTTAETAKRVQTVVEQIKTAVESNNQLRLKPLQPLNPFEHLKQQILVNNDEIAHLEDLLHPWAEVKRQGKQNVDKSIKKGSKKKVGEVKHIEQGSAVLIPFEDNAKKWQFDFKIDTEEDTVEDDVKVLSTEPITVDILDSSSEEDDVVILNP